MRLDDLAHVAAKYVASHQQGEHQVPTLRQVSEGIERSQPSTLAALRRAVELGLLIDTGGRSRRYQAWTGGYCPHCGGKI